jgi:hypothetical protein
MWAGYIFLKPEQIDINLPFEVIELPSSRTYVNYPIRESSILQAVDHVVHGGVTLVEINCIKHNPDNEVLKIGWDYSHYMSGATDLNRVENDCYKAIDALWDIFPHIKVYCSTVGGYHNLKDGKVSDDGTFISNKGNQWRLEQGWKPI